MWLLRWLKELARAARAPPLGAAPARIPYRCWPLGHDVLGHMHNASALTFADLARWHVLMRDGLFRKMWDTSTLYWIASQEVVYKREGRVGGTRWAAAPRRRRGGVAAASRRRRSVVVASSKHHRGIVVAASSRLRHGHRGASS